ncbi:MULTISPECIES: ribose ABC transporter substrate-binding protein RbsB [Exiguobacterium]|uniref:ribose ABC transporter substrate-binding protein RbsB n=2 Tax=Bacillales Family XII. Incertae Sedis TaxID=539742 RepID=UPI0004DF2426|nr:MULTISPECIES: ribose ABC transporter substrate-binding protein RbsB [Exiguobacterium]QPI67940.1 ribose ABC transporter substrate-binding protein RbsB [Exiguobacterium sp. PBE]MBG0918235.1 ribose ABC transporter substrate-binding protein RbsB [Exiguobacterium sp. SRB7LM]MBQ6460644.1 ribose ABC transporter substrate-binding protein RbsB [Exiguobacterium sp.]MBR3217835.1 ribose ABC transporter substrate-binding protein RbsB [Exiguobacterium sp.]MCV9900523.1 ribose ABC transporter substrate-bin
MKKWTAWLLALTMVLMAACSTEQPGSSSETETKDGDYEIGLSISTLNNPFFVALKEGAEEQANEMDATLTVADAQNDAAKQVNDVEDMIQKGMDLILINPTDSEAVGAAVQAANDAGIPVITVDRNAETGDVVAHVASDNVAGGQLAGDYMVELVGEGQKVVELEGIPGASATRDRGQGFNEAIDGKLEVVAKQSANFDRAEGLTVMENILQDNKDIVAVFAHNDEMALGAVQALEAAGMSDVKVIGFDATDDAVKAVEGGTMAATVAQKPAEIGKLGVEAAINHLKGETVEENIPVELELIK